MTNANNPLIFDGHNDTLLLFYKEKILGKPARSFFERSEMGHIDFPRAVEGGLGGGFFAIFNPNEIKPPTGEKMPGEDEEAQGSDYAYTLPLPEPVRYGHAMQMTMGMLRLLFEWEKGSNGRLQIVRTAAELEASLAQQIFAVILHFEGAEAIDTNLDGLYIFYELGLRSLGLVWSRPNAYGHGVPFNFPASPDIGAGLTDHGRNLVKACNELGVLVDLSHLNEKGFWDVADLSTKPLVCTHSGAFAMCASPRNLTDKQLDAIAETGGVTGVNYHTGFLRADGRAYLPTSVTEIVRHAAYIAERIGVAHVVLGSDFDGARMPTELHDVTGLPHLLEAFRAHGFSEEEIAQIAYGNWVRVLKETWGE